MKDTETARRVARVIMAYPYKLWGYGEGIALEALLAAGDWLGEPAYLRFVNGLLERWLAARRDIPYTDHVAPGAALLMVYERTHTPALLERAIALATMLETLPQTRQGARLHRPDHPGFAAYVYVDCMDFDGPFLARLGRVTGEARYFDLAADCLLGHARVLWDSKRRLFYHLYDARRDMVNGAFWGRGNAWAALGLVSTLELLPDTHTARGELIGLFQEAMASIEGLQTPEGDWHTVLDRPETYCEGSLCAMFYCALQRGLAQGLLPVMYQGSAARARQAMLARLGDNGVLSGVSQASPPGTVEEYARIATGGSYPWGQGPTLQAMLLDDITVP